MIMMGLKFMGDVPFHEVYIHGLVRDAEGQKMSKSKGNVLDPIDVIDGIDLESLVKKRTSAMQVPREAERVEKMTRKMLPDGIPAFGTDALRFTFAALASTGRDIKLDINRLEGYRNYCNKLWNAARYVLMQCEEQDTGLDSDDCVLSVADRWIISRLQQVEAEAADHLENYRFDLMAKTLYEFTWHEYCDWYLELSKPILFDDARAENEKRGTRRTLVRVLEALLRLQHPLMPFITEEIWQSIAPLAGVDGDTIMQQSYPKPDDSKIDKQAVAELEWMKEFIVGVRRIRSEMDIKPGKPLPVLLQNWSESDQTNFSNNESFITSLAKLESVTWLTDSEAAPESATALAGEMKILIPLAGLIDKDAELARLDKEMAKIEKNLEKTEAKLSNSNFVDRAPEQVVQVEKDRAAEMRTALSQLREQREKIQNM
jgi:valyl-tRNA synthetase